MYMKKILSIVIFPISTIILFLIPTALKFSDFSYLVVYLIIFSLLLPYLASRITTRLGDFKSKIIVMKIFFAFNLVLSFLYLQAIFNDSLSQIFFF